MIDNPFATNTFSASFFVLYPAAIILRTYCSIQQCIEPL